MTPRPDCSRVAYHVLGPFNICHHPIPEEADDNVCETLDPLCILRSHHAIVGVRQPQTPAHCKYQPLIGDHNITILCIRRYLFLLINSRYLRCRCSVTCFNLDKLQEMRPLGVVGFKIRLYTRVSCHTV